MIKKLLIIAIISSPTIILAEENFDTSNATEIDVSKKENIKDEINFIDKKAKNIDELGDDIEAKGKPVEIEEIGESELGQTTSVDEEVKIDENGMPIEEPAFIPKLYKGVHYSKNYQWFSLIKDPKSVFNQAFNELKIKGSMNVIKNDISTPKNIIINALYYDLIKHNPQIAENFYLIMYKNRKNTQNFSFKWSNLVLVDYLLRTGRVKAAKKIINPMSCLIFNKLKDKCYYYYGVVDYLTTGNSRNSSLQKAKNTIKKAELIYRKKPKFKRKKAW